MNPARFFTNRPFFIRLFNWEYWSFNTIYIPIYIVWIMLCIRARSFFFFAASNPRIKNGGFLNESKKDIYALVPAAYQPRTVFFSFPADTDKVLAALKKNGMNYPLIAKPDIGARGRGVKKLLSDDDVAGYLSVNTVDFHVQEFISFANEVGIFYYRDPEEQQGKISGIVRKEFLSVTGDGNASIRDLLKKKQRGILQLKKLEATDKNMLDEIPANNERRVVVPYGNHARGAMFVDDSATIDEALTKAIDGICRTIPEFYFGRLDIRYADWESLKSGSNFTVIEVNGAGSEPTHIYDPRHSIFFAWKEIIRHWLILWRISRKNHKRGFRYLTVGEGVRMFREDKMHSRKLAAMQV